jgi:predicted CXXCH cytochrome family protein
MRNVIRSLALVVGLTPAIALGAIKNSKHDLSNQNTGSGVEADATGAGGTDQTCIFCHTPHKASTNGLLWNRADGTGTGWGAAAKTLAGTTLPINTGIGAPSKRCLSCHDGTVALGDVMSKATDIEMVGGAGAGNNFITAAKQIGGAGAASMATNHPVSVPYPLAAGGNSYLGVATAVTAANATAGFAGVVGAGCESATGICTDAATTGTKINLFGTAAAPGVECGTCHEVHNKYDANGYFLRVGTGQSAICLACHKK